MPKRVGVPPDSELLNLAWELGAKWKSLGRALGIPESIIEMIDDEHRKLLDKAYNLLLNWKQGAGSEATYQALETGLCHVVVLRRDLAEKYCYGPPIQPQEHELMG